MNRIPAIVRIVSAGLSLLVGYSCADNQTSPGVEPSPQAQAGAKIAPAQAGGGAPKLATSQTGVTVTGSQSGSVTVPAEKGGYLIRYRYKGYGLKLEVQSVLGTLNMIPGGQSPGSDGWTRFDDLTSFNSTADQQYQLTASEPFEIEFVRLPLRASPDTPPRSYSGRGLKVVGPVSLKAGSASFKVSCPDLKQAGFVAELYDGRTAQNKGIIALGTGAKVDETKKLQVPSAGDYLLKVNANGRADWAIEVTQ
ncbi:MAG: hypothetical protein ACE15E_02015 [Acidobacteriota bacterium]